MARLIPATIDPSSPPGERELFRLLLDAPSEWTVLHGLDLAPWNSSRRTELDFVLIIPDTGILCIEAKSHPRIEFDGENWYPRSIKRSPFKQAMDACYALHRRLKALAEWTASVPMVHMCVFTESSFDVGSVASVGKWQCLDANALRLGTADGTFASELKRRTAWAIESEGFPVLRAPLSKRQVDDLVRLCVPVRKQADETRSAIANRALELESLLRVQQKAVVKLFESNERIIVTGPAGTGKTLIAMELASREAASGRRVALFSFNASVGDWMEHTLRARGPAPTLVVGSVYRVLMRLFDIARPADARDDFWTHTIPLDIEERLTDPSFADDVRFDTVIVDEAQDFSSRPVLMDLIDLILVGGWNRGRYALLGDVDNQVLTLGADAGTRLSELRSESGASQWHMDENVRNTKRVAEAALLLSGHNASVYGGYLRTSGSAQDVQFVPHNGRNQVEKLREQISAARGAGYRENQITVLSFSATTSSAADQLVREGFRLVPPAPGEQRMTFASVSSFKGLENEFIILTDIDLSLGDASRALFYTAVTRSTGMVRILCTQEDSSTLLDWWRDAN